MISGVKLIEARLKLLRCTSRAGSASISSTQALSAAGIPAGLLLGWLLGGALVMTIRKYGIYLDGVPFAILLANLVAPLLDSIRPKPFGVR